MLKNEYKNKSYTLDTLIADKFRPWRLKQALPQQSWYFETEPLKYQLDWIGAPYMEIFVSSNYTKFPIHAQIYEVDSQGKKYFINRINYTGRGWKPGTSGVIKAFGIAHAHRFSVGSKIRVEFTNVDESYRKIQNNVPFVIPLFMDASVTFYFDIKHPSYIEFPVIQSASEDKQ